MTMIIESINANKSKVMGNAARRIITQIIIIIIRSTLYSLAGKPMCESIYGYFSSYLEDFLKMFSYRRDKLLYYQRYFVMRRSILFRCLCPNSPSLGKEKENEVSRIDRKNFPSILPINLSPQCALNTESATLHVCLCIESSM